MAGKAKFDQEAAFKSIIGTGRESEHESQDTPVVKGKIRIGYSGRIFWIEILIKH